MADGPGRTFASRAREVIDYLDGFDSDTPGAVDRLADRIMDLALIIEEMAAAHDAAEPPTNAPGRREGTVTRWDTDATAGFITAADGVSWFCSQASIVGGPQKLPTGTAVTFTGRPTPRPGKRYPEAFHVEVDRG